MLRRLSLVALMALACLGVCGTRSPSWARSPLPDHPVFRVTPYLQNPGPHSLTLRWVAYSPDPASVQIQTAGVKAGPVKSSVSPAQSLDYTEWEKTTFFPDGSSPQVGYIHTVRLDGLKPASAYHYQVDQNGAIFEGNFRTSPAPGSDQPVRFVAYADCETEPESHGARVEWDDPAVAPEAGQKPRLYLLDQTTGYRANLEGIRQRTPDFIVIAGDIVESGGEQRDWDEFWEHNAPSRGSHFAPTGIASEIPILPAVGNHEYYAGPKNGGYQTQASEKAVAKYLSYFDVPDNHATDPRHHGRYYRLDYGPVTLISIDGCNGQPHQSEKDSNFFLQSDSGAPDFNPGSEQYRWLEQQLAEADRTSKFIFVTFHHCPISCGIHGAPPGQTPKTSDTQSGQPLRALIPLFCRYHVDVLLNGHDETFERSEIEQEGHRLQIYDVGVGGDGLRGFFHDNPHQKFLAHRHSREVWKDGELLDGGKHYGHLEVNVKKEQQGWVAELTPVYLFPLRQPGGEKQKAGDNWRFERRVYPDQIRLHSRR